MPTRFLINQCQIITFLILKSDIIKNSRIELRGIPSNQIKVTVIIIFPFNLVHCDFFLFHIEIEGKGGWIIGGGRQRVCPPLSNYWGGGGWPPWPLLPTPMNKTRMEWHVIDCLEYSLKLTRHLFLWKYTLKLVRRVTNFG